jgi:O-antigen/teichoic acid export membrane protein
MDALWRRSTIQSFLICLLGMGSLLLAIPFIGLLLPKVPARLAPFAVNAWLAGAMLIQTLIGAMANELRAHKREPFMWIAVANAILSVAFILPLVHYWGITGEAMGFALAMWAIFIPACQIYRVKRLEYRREADAGKGAVPFQPQAS